LESKTSLILRLIPSLFFFVKLKTLLDKDPLIKRLAPHETEIFHFKPANPTRPQYIGSDLHFSCGFEVQSFEWGSSFINISLKNEYEKSGSIFLFIPETDGNRNALDSIDATVNGEAIGVEVVARPIINDGKTKNSRAGRVIKVRVNIAGLKEQSDGKIEISW